MRKLTVALFAATAALSLSACDKKAEEAPATTAATEDAMMAEPSAEPSAVPSEQTGPVERQGAEEK